MPDIPPSLRSDVEIIPAEYNGKKGLLIRDSLGLIADPVFVQGMGVFILTQLDGLTTLEDIWSSLVQQSGDLSLSREQIGDIISRFDEACLLDSPTYHAGKKNILDAYSRESVRRAALAGTSYPGEEADLRLFLDDVLSADPGGDFDLPSESIRAVIAPHIDIGVGRTLYAGAYNAVREWKPRRIVILGTGHHLSDAFFSLTDKDFETPLGTVRADHEWIDNLRAAGEELISPADIVHRSEHSIEFQLLFCQRIFGPSFSIVPLLCGSFRELLSSVSRPTEVPGLEAMSRTLRHMLDESPDTLVVAGVDLSHIGLKFGHSESALSLLLETREFDDRQMERFCEGDIEAFWEGERHSGSRFNVCGFSALSFLMEVFPDLKGVRIGYDIWREEPTQSAVSFASMVLKKKEKLK
ncbi:MAG: AmmeMemoRadiSam system protein B [Candidatus Aminicenantes bacterium]|nr:AmmeMemoRadiSam system protein B [Candidatus Aminicenantes bacterium]